jgi:hypothetical protein
MLTELKRLAGEFAAQPLTRGREMRDMLEHSPGAFCAAAVEILSGEDCERVKRYLVAMLWTNNLLIPCLTDPSTPPQKAEIIAALARRVDPQLPAKLVGFVLERTELEPPECLERVLGLLKSMPDAASFRPLLTPLLRHPNARIRSKVALLAGEGNRNRTWFERRMQEGDPRVRANAIESAGSAEDLRPVFRTAALDSNNRVVGNALVSLYRLGETDAIASLHEMTSHPDPAFRATAVWAMGETADTRFLPLLARILTDPNETIKAAAFRAIRRLRGLESVTIPSRDVRILNEPFLRGAKLKVVFGVSDSGQPVRGIPPTAFRISVNGEPVYRYAVAEQESRRRIAVAFLIPRILNQKRERREDYGQALERCFERRQGREDWTLVQHSGSLMIGIAARPETLFGVRIDSQETNAIRPIPKLADIRAALDSAESPACPNFGSAFLAACQELRSSRASSHIFLLHPETVEAIDIVSLTTAAREAQAAVHAVCQSHDARFRELCRTTNGFYTTGEELTEMLTALYGGISHRYEATLTPEVEARQIQITVRSTECYGESPVIELRDEPPTGKFVPAP